MISPTYSKITTVFQIAILTAFLGNLSSQEESFTFEQLTIKDGLSHNSVQAIFQDHHGFMWFGTPNGLNRYDGFTFVSLSELIGKKEEIRYINCISEMKNKKMWIGTQKEGIFILDREKGETLNYNNHKIFENIKGVWVTKIFEDSRGNIWVGSLGKGFLKTNDNLTTFQHFSSSNNTIINNNFIMDFAEDSRGNIWVASAGESLIKVTPEDETSILNAENTDNFEGFRKVLYSDKENNVLWVGSEGSGLYKVTLTDLEIIQFQQNTKSGINHDRVRDIIPYRDNLLLVATDGGGLNVIDKKTNELVGLYTSNDPDHGLNANGLLDLFVDLDENVWVGTFNGGVNVYKSRKTRFSSMKKNVRASYNLLPNSSVLSMVSNRRDYLYAGTDGGGLSKINLIEKRADFFKTDQTLDRGIKSNVVKSLLMDSKSRIWMGFFNDGLDLLGTMGKAENTDLKIISEIIPENANVWSIVEDNNEGLWIGTLGVGLYHYKPSNAEIVEYRASGQEGDISDDDIMCLIVDSKGKLWVGTGDAGVNIFNAKENKFKQLRHDPKEKNGLSSDAIRAMFEDTKGNILVGSEAGGLNIISPSFEFKHIGTEQGLVSNDIVSITEDNLGFIWVASQNNISRISLESMEVNNFYFEGEESNQFNQMAVFKGKGGSIYFGGINGIEYIDPSRVKQNEIEPNIVFTNFKVNNNKAIPDSTKIPISSYIEDCSTVTLYPGQNVFSIEFSALDYTAPNNINFKYKMDGFSEKWTQIKSNERKITFTNLNPGEYTFQVMATNSAGIWNKNPASIDIVILPSFWKTIWFKSIAIAVLAFITFFAIRLIMMRREFLLKQRVLKAKSEILKLNNDKLESELTIKNTKLMSTTLQMAHKNEILSKIQNQLNNTYNENKESVLPKLRGISRSIDIELKNEDFWDQFNFFFDQINQNYLSRLSITHDQLSQNDIKMCALIKTGLRTKEIASVINISVRGAEKARYRLKKKLDLKPDESLSSYLMQF